MAQITIITPVYKVETCLDRCVQSILAQTFEDFCLILVDDGSPDRSGQICDDYASRDSRIHVLHQANAGAAAARNAGLDWAEAHTQSPWFCFVDSDDWVHPQMLELLLNAAQETETAISVCHYVETDKVLPWEEEEGAPEVWTPGSFYQAHYIGATVPWGKLYRRELFSAERYPVGKYLDDEFLTYRLLFAAGRLAVVPRKLYGYYVNLEGLTKCGWNPRLLYAWQAYEEQIAFFTRLGDEEMVRFRYRDYIDSGKTQLAAAAANGSPLIPRMKKHLRTMVPRAWKLGYIEFWFDYDFLKELYPLGARVLRFIMERKR